MDNANNDYKKVLSEVIKKQIVILGPDITFAKARNVPGLVVDSEGNVIDLKEDPQKIMQNLINQFVQLSGLIVQKTMEPLLSNYPNLAANLNSPIAQAVIPAGKEESIKK